MTAYKVISIIDKCINRLVTILAIPIFLFGAYFVADSAYVFNHAAAGGLFGRQQQQNVEEIMKELTDEAVAWLKVDDSKIDYPVMRADNNTKYLNTDPYGDYNIAGAIFMDFRCSGDFGDPYTVLYGHHMENGYMFGALDQFEDRDYFEAHRTGTLTVDGTEYPFRIFAFAVAEADDPFVFEPDNAYYVRQYVAEHATIYHEPGDGRLFLMSTCRSSGATDRTLVYAEILEQGGDAE